MEEKTIRKNIDIIKQTGATFTPTGLSYFLAEKLLNYQSGNYIKILDPACGDGALLIALTQTLRNHNKKFEIIAYDSNNDYLKVAKHNLLNIGINEFKLIHQDFLQIISLKKKQLALFDLVGNVNSEFADMIIANPPYVRTQILGSEQAQNLSKKFGLKGRVDLYYPFLIAMTHALKEDGILGAITSNRYLFTKSGGSIRKFLYENYHILEVIDLGDTKLFNAAVLPAIFIGKKKANANNSTAKFTKIYEELNGYSGDKIHSKNVYEILNASTAGYFLASEKILKKTTGLLKFRKNKENSWTLFSSKEAEWISEIEKNSHSIVGDTFKVRVGIKTTADKVFISEKWNKLNGIKPEEELLKDLISQENIKPWGSCNDKKLKVLYPHYSKEGKRETIRLEDYPKTCQYLSQHEEVLKGRKYLNEAGRKWFEIWVPQNPALWDLPKLVFPDISVNPRFYFDDTGKIVNGNCYWIVAKENKDVDKLLLIQGISNSKLMTKYHDLVFNNRLYSGRRRFFSQYVENYPLPSYNSQQSLAIIEIVKQINNDPENSNIDELIFELEKRVAKAYGVMPIFSLD